MTIYYMTILAYVFGYLIIEIIKQGLKFKGNGLFIGWFVFLFGGLSAARGATVGTDTGTYSNVFTSSGTDLDLHTIVTSKYPLYEVYNHLLYRIDSSSQVIIVINSLFIITIIGISLNKLSKSFFVSSLLYVTCYYFFQSMNLSRQFMAIALVMLGVAYLVRGKPKYFWLFEVLAILIHSTALIGISFYVIYKIKWSIRAKLTFVVTSLGCVYFAPILMPVIVNFFPDYALYEANDSLLSFSSQSNGGQVYVYVFYMMLTMVGLLLLKRFPELRTQEFVFLNLVMVVTGILGILMAKQILISRLVLYFAIFAVIYIPNVIFYLSQTIQVRARIRTMLFYFLNVIVILITLIPMSIQLIKNISGVVPYYFVF